jgi:hypothetical protein
MSRRALTVAARMSDRRRLAQMQETLALARVARDESRAAHARARQALDAAERELATILRRGALAAQINDAETVAVAERFAGTQREQVARLARKEAVLLEDVVAAERTVQEMEQEWQSVSGRAPSVPPTADAGSDSPADAAAYRSLDDAARAAAADARLEELKRRMGRS